MLETSLPPTIDNASGRTSKSLVPSGQLSTTTAQRSLLNESTQTLSDATTVNINTGVNIKLEPPRERYLAVEVVIIVAVVGLAILSVLAATLVSVLVKRFR